VFHQFVIRVKDRDDTRRRLGAAGIATGIYYPRPLPRMEPLLRFATGEYPHAETACRESLALPVYPQLTDGQVEEVLAEFERAPASTGP
jgi:dTDP-4-amino-4,6-dideoxygalactose transaminase